MSKRVKKKPHWLYATLVAMLMAMVTMVLLPDDEQPQPTQSSVVMVGPEAGQHEEAPVAFEELGEDRNLQAPKHVDVVVHNGYPEAGIALVMDDVGYDLRALKRLLALPFPVAISILPDAPDAAAAAEMAHRSGRVVMLHLPMEPTTPKYRANMSSAFLRVEMNEGQVRQKFQQALEEIPYVAGVNNHMGSLLTTLEEPMRWVMDVCKEHALFFIDSKTAHNSVAADIAEESGIAWGARRIFLDHTVEAEDLKMAWASAVRCAKQKGSCIVIAHPHAETLNFLEQQVREEDRGLMRPVTSMLHSGGVS